MQVMKVPTEFELGNPIVEALRSLGGKGSKSAIAGAVITLMQLPENVVRQPHGTGGQTEFDYRLAWGLTVLKTCGLAVNPKRGTWELTQAGSRHQTLDATEIKRQYFHYLSHAGPPPDAEEDEDWQRLGLKEFLSGYSEEDSIYDTFK